MLKVVFVGSFAVVDAAEDLVREVDADLPGVPELAVCLFQLNDGITHIRVAYCGLLSAIGDGAQARSQRICGRR
jgi:hypothetical protein